jgi:hypothetical protein
MAAMSPPDRGQQGQGRRRQRRHRPQLARAEKVVRRFTVSGTRHRIAGRSWTPGRQARYKPVIIAKQPAGTR